MIDRHATQARIATTNRELRDAIRLSRMGPERLATAVRYDEDADEVVLSFASGARLAIPRSWFSELKKASRRDLRKMELLGSGSAFHWPELESGRDIAELLDSIFETRRRMREIAKRGGSSRSEKKAAAARENGKKGGRPRKTA